MYEEALSLCSICTSESSFDQDAITYVSVPDIHKKYAYSIYQRGDYDGAITHFLLAETKFKEVLALFPELFPKNFSKFDVYLQDTSGFGNGRASSSAQGIHRAASAVALFCEKVRPTVKSLAEKAEKSRIYAATLGANPNKQPRQKSISEDFSSTLLLTMDTEELIRDAIILDSIYISALIHCIPARKPLIMSLLCKHNYCYVDSCSILIASQGNAYTGWYYIRYCLY